MEHNVVMKTPTPACCDGLGNAFANVPDYYEHKISTDSTKAELMNNRYSNQVYTIRAYYMYTSIFGKGVLWPYNDF